MDRLITEKDIEDALNEILTHLSNPQCTKEERDALVFSPHDQAILNAKIKEGQR